MRTITSLSTTLLLLLFAQGTLTADANAEDRLLHFPGNRAVGVVHQRPKHSGSYMHTQYDKFVAVGDARGDVSVGRDVDVRLDVSKAASRDLSFLTALQPDDIQVLRLRETDVNDDQLRHVAGLTGLRILDLEQTRITDAGVAHLAPLKKLQEISLEAFRVHREGFGVGDEAMVVLGSLPGLESVGLRLTKVTNQGLEQLCRAKSLRHIGIQGTPVTDEGLAALSQLPHLENLDLGVYGDGAPITDHGLQYIGELVAVRHLDLSGTKITNDGLPSLAGLANLESLSMDETKVTEAGLVHLKPLKSLQSLRFYNDVTDAGAAHLAELKSLRKLTSNMDLTEKGVALLSTLPHLESLSLTDDQATDDCLKHASRMTSLKYLSIQNCPITDNGLAYIANLKNIDRIAISRTKVTGDGLQHLQQLPNLKILHLDFGSRDSKYSAERPHLRNVGKLSALTFLDLGGEGLNSGDLSELNSLMHLEDLEIDDLPVDDQAAIDLAGITSLTSLSIENGVITDKGLSQLANLRRLGFLQLTGHFTDAGLNQLAMLRTLNRIYLSSPYITDEGVNQLAAALPSLQRASRSEYGDGPAEISLSDKDSIRRRGLAEQRVEKNSLEGLDPPAFSAAGWLNTDGKELTLQQLRGKVVLVDFWGTWCGPCIASIPKLQAMHDKYGEKGFVIVGLHTTGESEKMPPFVEEKKIPWPVAHDVDEATVGAWKVDSYPQFCLIDRTGKLRMHSIYRADLERAIYTLINEQAAAQPASR